MNLTGNPWALVIAGILFLSLMHSDPGFRRFVSTYAIVTAVAVLLVLLFVVVAAYTRIALAILGAGMVVRLLQLIYYGVKYERESLGGRGQGRQDLETLDHAATSRTSRPRKERAHHAQLTGPSD